MIQAGRRGRRVEGSTASAERFRDGKRLLRRRLQPVSSQSIASSRPLKAEQRYFPVERANSWRQLHSQQHARSRG
jgi:hypothetical protein